MRESLVGGLLPPPRSAQLGSDDDLYVAAIRMGRADAIVDGIHVADSAPEPIEIVLKANGGQLDCTLRDEGGNVVPGAHVLLRPDGPAQRALALYGNCQTDAAGACKITGITPGEYHVYAFPAEIEPDTRDPDSFKAFDKFAKKVKVAEGERQEIELKLALID